jgi:hypothetical protein
MFSDQVRVRRSTVSQSVQDVHNKFRTCTTVRTARAAVEDWQCIMVVNSEVLHLPKLRMPCCKALAVDVQVQTA